MTNVTTPAFLHFIKAKRVPVDGEDEGVRIVFRSEVIRAGPHSSLEKYVADRAPFFYRDVSAVIADLSHGYFFTAIKNTLSKLPTSASFQQSHFGEIVAAIFAEEVMGLRRVYSKLTLLTAENANAYKMDLVLYDRSTKPFGLVFAEVKCSPKCADDGLPAGHDGSCFADIFKSFNGYTESDKTFDLTAANDQLHNVAAEDREDVRAALAPYSGVTVRYAAFAVIDAGTYSGDEAQLLRTRKNSKVFDVDLVCLESFPAVSTAVYGALHSALKGGS